MLGVHYVSDVVGAWALGVAWLGLTAYAFELMRQETHRPVTHRPVTPYLKACGPPAFVAIVPPSCDCSGAPGSGGK